MEDRNPAPEGSKDQARTPDEEFKDLYYRFYGPVHNFFMNRGLRHSEADELSQETFLHAYRSLERFRREGATTTWLFVIAGNLWRNYLRHRHSQKRAATLESPVEELPAALSIVDEAPGPEERALQNERMTLFRETIERMPSQMRYCLTLRMHGKTYAQIAKMLGLSSMTVKVHLLRARKRLRRTLLDR